MADTNYLGIDVGSSSVRLLRATLRDTTGELVWGLPRLPASSVSGEIPLVIADFDVGRVSYGGEAVSRIHAGESFRHPLIGLPSLPADVGEFSSPEITAPRLEDFFERLFSDLRTRVYPDMGDDWRFTFVGSSSWGQDVSGRLSAILSERISDEIGSAATVAVEPFGPAECLAATALYARAPQLRDRATILVIDAGASQAAFSLCHVFPSDGRVRLVQSNLIALGEIADLDATIKQRLLAPAQISPISDDFHRDRRLDLLAQWFKEEFSRAIARGESQFSCERILPGGSLLALKLSQTEFEGPFFAGLALENVRAALRPLASCGADAILLAGAASRWYFWDELLEAVLPGVPRWRETAPGAAVCGSILLATRPRWLDSAGRGQGASLLLDPGKSVDITRQVEVNVDRADRDSPRGDMPRSDVAAETAAVEPAVLRFEWSGQDLKLWLRIGDELALRGGDVAVMVDGARIVVPIDGGTSANSTNRYRRRAPARSGVAGDLIVVYEIPGTPGRR